MNILDLKQGSEEWHKARLEHFTASEAPAMMNASKFQTRDELLLLKKTGIAPEISPAQQRIFDKGHATEAMARPFIEAYINEDLFPVTGSLEAEELPLLASFDGLTMLEDAAFEHKLWNEALAQSVKLKELPPHYYWQLEQQLLVSGAEKVIFVCSDGTADNMEIMEYFPIEGRREQLIAGWKQFKEDLTNFEAVAPKVEPVAEVITDLPALVINLTGSVTQSNLTAYKSTALDFIKAINTDLQTDEDFANAESTIKFCGKAEKELISVKKRALEQTSDINTLFQTVDELKEEMRQKRLTLEKLVKSQKLAVRAEIIGKAKTELREFISLVESGFRGKAILTAFNPDFDGAAKGKRTISSLQNAVNSELAKVKIEITGVAKTMGLNLEFAESMGEEYWPLFRDIQTLITMDCDQFREVIKSRIEQHKAAERAKDEARKAEEERRVQAGKEAEERRIAEVKAQAEREKERAVKEAEEKAKQEAEAELKKIRAKMVAEQAAIDAEIRAKIEKEQAEKPAKETPKPVIEQDHGTAKLSTKKGDLPCPFCGSKTLTKALWYINDEEAKAIECGDCYAGAPVDTWNRRASMNIEQSIKSGEAA